eukprot:TRINITY_DN6869_c0_g1_i2.p1 TRINITY_DN6869_c0_g1~~TRINITY_DN6869_c0_g1_i2.p1  ORF type:complete len:177 (-),score=37.26 TRINITY_DN6869_c0_g1_i2:61-591(-)
MGGRGEDTTSALNSAKLYDLNRLNNQRLDDLGSLTKKSSNGGGDELDKLDNLLLDIIKSEHDKDKPGDTAKSGQFPPRKSQQLDSIREVDWDDSLKLRSAKSSAKPGERDLSLGGLQLPTLQNTNTVSYTHLTLPTILLVQISVVAVSLKKKKKKRTVCTPTYIDKRVNSTVFATV